MLLHTAGFGNPLGAMEEVKAQDTQPIILKNVEEPTVHINDEDFEKVK